MSQWGNLGGGVLKSEKWVNDDYRWYLIRTSWIEGFASLKWVRIDTRIPRTMFESCFVLGCPSWSITEKVHYEFTPVLAWIKEFFLTTDVGSVLSFGFSIDDYIHGKYSNVPRHTFGESINYSNCVACSLPAAGCFCFAIHCQQNFCPRPVPVIPNHWVCVERYLSGSFFMAKSERNWQI